ncbi:MAG: protease inhibitor I9 family protein [Anaerolineales bacterium]|nr:protease inhibitor I9 family protein [Anaerolineales bacterium]
MKQMLSIFAVIAILLTAFVQPGMADGVVPVEPLSTAPSAETGEMVNETSTLWFVELNSAPAADGTSPMVLKSEKAAFRANAGKAGLKFSERYAFDTLWNGLSIQIDPSQVAALSRIPGVKAIYPVETIPMPETSASEPELFTSIAMTGADIAQNELGYTGKGIKVAVMDTGVDYDHPDLGGCFGPGCRVAYGYDLVGDAFNADDTSV